MEELTTVDGTVHSIIFQNAENGYTVLRLLTAEGEVVTVVDTTAYNFIVLLFNESQSCSGIVGFRGY